MIFNYINSQDEDDGVIDVPVIPSPDTRKTTL